MITRPRIDTSATSSGWHPTDVAEKPTPDKPKDRNATRPGDDQARRRAPGRQARRPDRGRGAPAAPDTAPEFLDSDPWRSLRILSEFVEGFDALAAVGPAVSVFGSARTKPTNRYYKLARQLGTMLGEAGLRGDHRRRARDHGGGQSRGAGGRRPVGRLQHRAADGAGAQSVRRPRDRVPLLLRPQGDVREVRGRVRDLPRRLRHARRAVRGADADPDQEGPGLPGDPHGHRLLDRHDRLDPRDAARRRRPSPRPTSTCCASPTTRPRRSRSSTRTP